jgi:hypothetical protein
MSQRSMYAKQDPKEIIDQFVSCPMTAEVVNAASMAFKTVLTERRAKRAVRLLAQPA